MASITLHPRSLPQLASTSPLPELLQTPSGLALLELQGIINFPKNNDENNDDDSSDSQPADERTKKTIPVGRVAFPDYNPASPAFDPASTAWMKSVYMYVGEHQRLLGEVKKLPKALGVVRRRGVVHAGALGHGNEEGVEELELVEVVKYKIVFEQRPEPVTGMGGDAGTGTGS